MCCDISSASHVKDSKPEPESVKNDDYGLGGVDTKLLQEEYDEDDDDEYWETKISEYVVFVSHYVSLSLYLCVCICVCVCVCVCVCSLRIYVNTYV